MKNRFFVWAFSLVLVLCLCFSAFAVSPPISTPLQQTTYNWYGGSQGETNLTFPVTLPPGVVDLKFTFQRLSGNGGNLSIFGAGASELGNFSASSTPQSFLLSSYPGATSLSWGSGSTTSADSYFKLTVDYIYAVSVVPSFSNPVVNGTYSVSGLVGDSADVNMFVTKDQPKNFVFSGVNAPAGTKVSYAITSEGGAVTYHDIADLADGLSIDSADYPVASYFTVRNSDNATAAYTVTVSDAVVDKSSGLALSIWETCLSMGTAFIGWVTTGSNFIALIPLVLMILVFAILFIRKLIKGV